MSYSLGETRYLSKYAARGAGLSWGMADEAADAVVWLQSRGLPGAQMLLALLTLNDLLPACEFAPTELRGDWSAGSGRLCPLAAGAALSDSAFRLGTGETIRMVDITHPLLLIPFAASAAATIGAAVALEWQGTLVVVGEDGLEVSGSGDELLAHCLSEVRCFKYERAQLTSTASASAFKQNQASLDDDCWSRLTQFVQRTYAPATEYSRKSGAGAGLVDND